jgi:hypothetical protein
MNIIQIKRIKLYTIIVDFINIFIRKNNLLNLNFLISYKLLSIKDYERHK